MRAKARPARRDWRRICPSGCAVGENDSGGFSTEILRHVDRDHPVLSREIHTNALIFPIWFQDILSMSRRIHPETDDAGHKLPRGGIFDLSMVGVHVLRYHVLATFSAPPA